MGLGPRGVKESGRQGTASTVLGGEGHYRYTSHMDIIAASLAGALVIAVAIVLALRKAGSRGGAGQGKGGGSTGRRTGNGSHAVPAGHAGRSGPAGGADKTGSASPRGIQPHCCPLCSSPLASGERVKSDLSAGNGDRIMRIFGCPACWPSMDGRPPRRCPVCGLEIPREGYAVARYFERPGRKHVHVLGCSKCRPGA